MKHQHSGNMDKIQYMDSKLHKLQSYVKVRAASTFESFQKKDSWFDEVLMSNSNIDKNKSAAVCRTVKACYKRDPDSVLQALKDVGVHVVNQIDAVSEAAMWKAGGIRSIEKRNALRRHLRYHMGKNVLDSEQAQNRMHKGHAQVFTSSIEYNKDKKRDGY